jgi:pentatricopeptide repeat protein
MKKAEQAANKAISLNATQAEAYGCLGYKNFTYDWDPSATIHYLEKAIEFNPNYAPAHYWKVQYLLIYSADTVECNNEIEKAIAIDPLSPMPHYMNGEKLMSQDRFQAAIHSFKLAADFHSSNSFCNVSIGYCLLALGKPDEAIKSFEEARSDRGTAALIYIYANDGKKEKAESLYNEMLTEAKHRYLSKVSLANAASFMGLKDKAHEFMKLAFEERDPILGFYPIVSTSLPNDVMSDPRNVKLMDDHHLRYKVKEKGKANLQ